MSLAASGTIAKTLTYATWKGVKYARQRVDPANPNSAAQQSQRSYLATAVAAWRSASVPLNAVDKENFERAALYAGKPLSGFNLFVAERVDTLVAGADTLSMNNTVEESITASGATIKASHVSSSNCQMVYGTSPTGLFTIKNRTESSTPGVLSTFALTGLSASTKYYYKIRSIVTDSVETLGIGTFTTAAS
jgi:hypothetical protein